jgi:hypothetical protein
MSHIPTLHPQLRVKLGFGADDVLTINLLAGDGAVRNEKNCEGETGKRVFHSAGGRSSVEIMGAGFRSGNEQRKHTLGFDGDHVVLILQDPLDHQETF